MLISSNELKHRFQALIYLRKYYLTSHFKHWFCSEKKIMLTSCFALFNNLKNRSLKKNETAKLYKVGSYTQNLSCTASSVYSTFFWGNYKPLNYIQTLSWWSLPKCLLITVIELIELLVYHAAYMQFFQFSISDCFSIWNSMGLLLDFTIRNVPCCFDVVVHCSSSMIKHPCYKVVH